MRKTILAGLLVMGLACILLSCSRAKRPAAPMAQQQNLVQSKLTALPEELGQVTLLGRGEGLLLETAGQVYEVQGGAYRCLEQEGILAVANGRSGECWTALNREDGCTLVKTNSQGTVLSQLKLGMLELRSLVTTDDGRVCLSAGNQIHVFSAEGVQLGVVSVEAAGNAQILLAAGGDRVFARWWELGKSGMYIELLPDLTLGEPFSGVVSGSQVWPLGSFLPGYLVMEKDDVGLYARSEDGTWETVCRWEDLHLDGAIDPRLLDDSQGGGLCLYEAGGVRYCLRLYEK